MCGEVWIKPNVNDQGHRLAGCRWHGWQLWRLTDADGQVLTGPICNGCAAGFGRQANSWWWE